MFMSLYAPFSVEVNEMSWEENNALLKQGMYETFWSQGIKVDSSSTNIEKIDGIDFHTFSFNLYSSTGNTVITQIIYSRLIDDKDFITFINYNNEDYKNEMLEAFRSSKFTKK